MNHTGSLSMPDESSQGEPLTDESYSNKQPEHSQQIQRLSDALNAFPAAFRGNPLHLLFLDDAAPIVSAPDYLRRLDNPALREQRREYLPASAPEWPFPTVQITSRPDPVQLSERLFERFDTARDLLLMQRQIGPELCRLAKENNSDVVVLLIVDGLSYYDLAEQADLRPCLVDGVSITQFGFREVVGKPSVSQQLFAMGYRQQLGFTFFDPQSNDLAADLYRVFATSQVERVNAFEDCLNTLKSTPMLRGFVQITAPGLDHLSHMHHDRPPRQFYLQQILDNFDAVASCLERQGRKYLLCLTADHGILWREHIPDQNQEPNLIISTHRPDDNYHPRYLKGAVLRDYARVQVCQGQTYSLLRFPYLTRAMKRTEWGVHGGLSAWESLVPFLTRCG